MHEYILGYGDSPEAPHSISFISQYEAVYNPSEVAITAGEVQTAVEDARSNGQFVLGDLNTNLIAAIFARSVAATFGESVRTFGVTLNRILDAVAGENVTSEFLDFYPYVFENQGDNPRFTVIPDAVMGFHGRTIPKNGTRMYKWGLLSNAALGAPGLQEGHPITVSEWQSTIDIVTAATFDFYFLLRGLQQAAVSSASSVDSSLVTVKMLPAVRHGVRRN